MYYNLCNICVIFFFPAEQNAEINLTCIVCMEDDVASIISKPCHHRCMCNNCWSLIKRTQRVCPLCRKEIISVLIC